MDETPFFPVIPDKLRDENGHEGSIWSDGILKTEMYALAILCAIVAKEGCTDPIVGDAATSSFAQNDAERAVIYAKALTRELARSYR